MLASSFRVATISIFLMLLTLMSDAWNADEDIVQLTKEEMFKKYNESEEDIFPYRDQEVFDCIACNETLFYKKHLMAENRTHYRFKNYLESMIIHENEDA